MLVLVVTFWVGVGLVVGKDEIPPVVLTKEVLKVRVLLLKFIM